MSNRREFIALLGGAAAWPVAARAQPAERVRRVGVLMPLAMDDPEAKARFAAFQQGLEQLGWTDGRNVQIDTRWAGGSGILLPLRLWEPTFASLLHRMSGRLASKCRRRCLPAPMR